MKNSAEIFLVILCLFASTGFCEIYKWTDANGKVHFTDNPKESPNAEQITVRVNSYESVNITDNNSATDTTATGKPKQVIIYSTVWCGYCKKAKKYFQENNIPYTDYDIEKDAAAKQKYKELGGKGVPLILVGQKRMDGFSVEGFQWIYK